MTVEMRLNCTGAWTDYTDSVDVTNLQVTKELDEDSDPKRSSTADIEAFNECYTFLYSNLINSVDRYSNSVCVRITDDLCSGNVYNFKTENRALKWCDNDECKLQLTLVEFNETLDCISRTTIADNTNGDFQQYPTSTMFPHPRFRYCDVIKPTFMFGALLTFLNSLDLLVLAINGMILTLNSGFNIINTILGTSLPTIGFISYPSLSLLGCDRCHPAPFVKTYIDNVCTICGITVDDVSSPIFHDIGNVYYYTAMLSAPITKGVKVSNPVGYIPSNQPSYSLSRFLSLLKRPFNSRWYYRADNSTLYFDRKDRIGANIWAGATAIDLTGTDADYLLGNVCYTWNGDGKPYRINMNWGTDAADSIGNEMLRRFNGEYLDGSSNNYNETIERDFSEFGASEFVLDGKDSAYDVILEQSVGAVLSGSSYEGCLKMTTDTCNIHKLIVWDGLDLEDARPFKWDYTDYAGIASIADDDANFFPIADTDCSYMNAPMSFDPEADAIHANMWSAFHSIDAPTNSKKTNIGFEMTLDFCNCNYISLDIYQTVLFQDGTTEGEINQVVFDYGKREIRIKGSLKD